MMLLKISPYCILQIFVTGFLKNNHWCIDIYLQTILPDCLVCCKSFKCSAKYIFSQWSFDWRYLNFFGRHGSKIKWFYKIFDARLGPTLIKNSLNVSAMHLWVTYFDFIGNNIFRKCIIRLVEMKKILGGLGVYKKILATLVSWLGRSFN